MTKALYLYDSYLKEFEAKVLKVEENKVILDQTAFYPWGGGLDNDKGKLIWKDKEYDVVDVRKDQESNNIIHFLSETPDFNEGEKVIGIIDWNRRYRIMRMHTAAHIISAILYNNYNVLITGGHITEEYAKDDFNIEHDNWKEIIEDVIKKANKIVEEARQVKIYFMPREEAFKIPGIVKLANKLPPAINELRIVEIEGVDIQADGGPHVKNTKEIGEIILIKAENKGKNRKRIYYTVKP